jgi:hypothetical protein
MNSDLAMDIVDADPPMMAGVCGTIGDDEGRCDRGKANYAIAKP